MRYSVPFKLSLGFAAISQLAQTVRAARSPVGDPCAGVNADFGCISLYCQITGSTDPIPGLCTNFQGGFQSDASRDCSTAADCNDG